MCNLSDKNWPSKSHFIWWFYHHHCPLKCMNNSFIHSFTQTKRSKQLHHLIDMAKKTTATATTKITQQIYKFVAAAAAAAAALRSKFDDEPSKYYDKIYLSRAWMKLKSEWLIIWDFSFTIRLPKNIAEMKKSSNKQAGTAAITTTA